jgi:hypothetical protein
VAAVAVSGGEDLFQPVLGQALAGLAIGAGVFVDRTAAPEAEERLHLADDLAAGGLGFEQLPEETLEGQPQAVDPVTAIASLLFLGQEVGWKDAFQVPFQFGQGGLADGVGEAPTAGSQAGAELRKEGRVHRAVYIPPY